MHAAGAGGRVDRPVYDFSAHHLLISLHAKLGSSRIVPELCEDVQAVACASAKASLISPILGRIMDWYTAKTGKVYPASEDPGVLQVQRIYRWVAFEGRRCHICQKCTSNVLLCMHIRCPCDIVSQNACGTLCVHKGAFPRRRHITSSGSCLFSVHLNQPCVRG